MNPSALAKLDQSVADTKAARRVIIQANDFARTQSDAAHRMAEHLRELAADDRVEWGRAIHCATSYVAGLYVDLHRANPDLDVAPILLNVGGWAGLELLDDDVPNVDAAAADADEEPQS